jgi:transcriptional regulator with XRE-family HTH domain
VAETPQRRTIEIGELGELIRRQRSARNLTLRQVEDQLNHAITASSLSRIEHGAVPEPRNVPILARWLNVLPEHIVWPDEKRLQRPVDTPTAVEVHLRADKKLAPDAAEALAALFRQLYDNVASGKIQLPPPARRPKR